MKMTEDALFNLRWDAQRSALLGSMASLYREEAFVDTTIVADNKIFKAHKLLLSASSSYLKNMLESVPALQHAVIFMPHIGASDLGNLLKFIYDGEIKINKRSLKSFLAVAKLLRIKGMDFELNEDLETNIPLAYAQNLSTSSPIASPSNPNKRLASEARLDEEANNSSIPSKILSAISSQINNSQRSTPPKENGQSFNSISNTAGVVINSSDDESTKGTSRPALIGGGSGRSANSSISSQASNNNNNMPSPHNDTSRLSHHLNHTTSNGDDNSQLSPPMNRNGGVDVEDDVQDDSNASNNPDAKGNTALNLHIGRYHNHNHDTESLDMDQDSRPLGDEREGRMSIHDGDMDDEYDDDDDSFSMSIQPEVSLRESDESFTISDRRHSFSHKPTSFSNSFNLSLMGNSALSVTPTVGGNLSGGGLSVPSSPLSLQQQLTLKHLSKLARPMIPKAHQLPGQGSPQSGGVSAINEGILMRMMREPLQGGSTSSKPSSSPGNSGFFDNLSHNDPNLLSAGLRKQKRYVACTSCSKVLSSLSALKRHMEDVHCARIQGKCLLCGRVYSSRNSLLTHVYSAHKLHQDYKAVARIIRESDFEQFATA
ncbi:broad-complex core protein isoforms 1/2/3/4/5 isoform X2 [Folsomia candida]|uniref:broad-complex core protein isoforms 1/2/3/4/5 isoform X2 n=1 Tax=Folsomia candida TaxID=158441 RepID=UPI0016050304|nr:broad-complex core protein isoforms 1/2/3/4/5 isoform X2 [Folsomia candida]